MNHAPDDLIDDLAAIGVARRPMSGPDLPWTRRRFLGTGAVLLGGVLAACGSDEGGPSSAGSSSTPSDTGATEASGVAFPRTIEHAAGSTRLETKPQRIVAATDGGDLASLLALGVTPVGFGQRNDPLTPWIAAAGGDNAAIKRYELTDSTNFELLASWQPDLIVGQFGFVTEETIGSYSAIAPTIATSFVGWRSSLRQTAASVGEDARAEVLIAEIETEIAAAGRRLAGAEIRMRWVFGFPGYIGQLNDQSPIGALLTEMGLASLPAQKVPGEAADEIAAESLGDALAGADAIVVLDFEDPAGDGTTVLSEQALYATSGPVTNGRVIELGVDESNAAYFDSVLTIRGNIALIERILGELA